MVFDFYDADTHTTIPPTQRKSFFHSSLFLRFFHFVFFIIRIFRVVFRFIAVLWTVCGEAWCVCVCDSSSKCNYSSEEKKIIVARMRMLMCRRQKLDQHLDFEIWTNTELAYYVLVEFTTHTHIHSIISALQSIKKFVHSHQSHTRLPTVA